MNNMGLRLIITFFTFYTSVIAQTDVEEEFVLSLCFEDNEFLIFKQEQVNFNQASQLCIDQEATLASIPNDKTNSHIVSTIQNTQNIFVSDFWFGLVRDVRITRFPIDPIDPYDPFDPIIPDPIIPEVPLPDSRFLQGAQQIINDFRFIDGTFLEDLFARIRGEFPWSSEQPNNADGDEDCILFSMNPTSDVQGVWSDESCERKRSLICSRQCTQDPILITNSPTVSPPPPIVTSCMNEEIELVLSSESFRQLVDANEFCLNQNAELISISNEDTFVFVQQTMTELGVFDLLWTGLTRAPSFPGADSDFDEPLATEFFFVDGTEPEEEFGLINEILPWFDRKPSLSGDFPTCVFLDPDLDFFYTDSFCDFNGGNSGLRRALCERSCSETTPNDDDNDENDDVDDEAESLEEDEVLSFEQMMILGGISVVCVTIVSFGLILRRKMINLKKLDNRRVANASFIFADDFDFTNSRSFK